MTASATQAYTPSYQLVSVALQASAGLQVPALQVRPAQQSFGCPEQDFALAMQLAQAPSLQSPLQQLASEEQ